ncbi:MAG TPA: penicillin-binding transpeptidase domain-containing protein, partial [Anaerolineales bacterium]|nr:penicillin-binding transpeptidase domain-containing protein [Anaerolineales bacterium]
MKPIRWLQLIFMFWLLAACTTPSTTNGTPKPGCLFCPAPTLPPAAVTVVHAKDARVAVTNFLEALKNNDFATMYALLSKDTQAAISQDDFSKKYNDALNTMGAAKFDYEVHTQTLNPNTAQVGFSVTYHTALVGDIQREISATLVNENGEWRIQWNPSLILPELTGDNVLKMEYQIPSRGDIYDRNGQPLVTQSDAYALGVTPGEMGDKSGDILVGELSKLCGISQDAIWKNINAAAPDWYVPVCEASPDEIRNVLDLHIAGLNYTPYNTRYYAGQGLASQAIGYTLFIPKEKVDQYRRQGYQGSERVGWAGVEYAMESYLAGKHGGTLYVVDPNGQLLSKIGSSDPQPADSIYLTIDSNLQHYAEKALTGLKGAVVVMERDTGRVLAMASSPGYDPNLFDPNNFNNGYQLNDLLNNPDQPQFNRATQSQVPLGSVFKTITFSAALESGLYEPQTPYDCEYDFTELVPFGGPVLYDWTYQHCQDDIAADPTFDCSAHTSTRPSGVITLQEGLMRSCDPYFWHIGLDLYNNNRAGDIATMAEAFGLGSKTSIVGLDPSEEAAGTITVPTEKIEATNQAIGQGDVSVSPLQVARFIAAIGNGGTLYTPQLIEKIQPVSGDPINTFKPAAAGTLPLNPTNLKALQDAMRMVVNDPRGTANFRLRGLNFPVAGKTGTAENCPGCKPYAWFGGYTLANEQDTQLPNIAVVVMVEGQGEGADWAAPIFRWMIETYY